MAKGLYKVVPYQQAHLVAAGDADRGRDAIRAREP